jgi:hypothetical protein
MVKKNWGDRRAGPKNKPKKRKTKLPNKRKSVNLNPLGKDQSTRPLGGVRSRPGASTRFKIPSYKQALKVKITEISEKVLELNPLVQTPLPITGGVGITDTLAVSPSDLVISACFV